jgi:hypothetical protein
MNDPRWVGPRISFPDRCNPITIFVRIARAVHLAVALKLKIEQEIADLRAGKSLGPITCTVRPEDRGEPIELRDGDGAKPPHAGVQDVEVLQELKRPEILPRVGKTPLSEADRFHRLLNGPLKDAVAAICADLGLGPDWSLWTEDGFPPPPGGDVRVWDIFRSSEIETPPPPDVDDDGNDSGDDAAHIVWRPRWRKPRRSRAKPPIDPRHDRGPATWPDANDFYYGDAIRNEDVDRL